MSILGKFKGILGSKDVNRPEIEYRCMSCDSKFTLLDGDEVECPECGGSSITTVDPQA